MLAIMFYTLFMNEKSVFRDLFFFSFQFGYGSILAFYLWKIEILKKTRVIYFFAFIFNLLYLILIYGIYFIKGAEEYFNNMISEKLGLLTGTLIFFILVILRISIIKEK
jgi:hypothetical protein